MGPRGDFGGEHPGIVCVLALAPAVGPPFLGTCPLEFMSLLPTVEQEFALLLLVSSLLPTPPHTPAPAKKQTLWVKFHVKGYLQVRNLRWDGLSGLVGLS